MTKTLTSPAVIGQKNHNPGSGNAPIPRAEMCSLAQVLTYQHSALVARMQKEMGIEEKVAHALFHDLLIFLYVCGAYRERRPFFPPPLIDEAWHTFLLFTKDYQEFCHKNFGMFVHHSPITPEMRVEHKLAKVDKGMAIQIATELTGQLSSNWEVPLGVADCEQSCSPSYDCGD